MKIDEILNVKGKVCPEPAAETRLALRKLESGKILQVEGDFECAADNVANMAEKQGSEVLSKESSSNYFKVIIRKK